jgi:hypothetical protein
MIRRWCWVSMSANGFRGLRRTVGTHDHALASLPVRAIVTTGGLLDPDDLPTAHNVHIVSSTAMF